MKGRVSKPQRTTRRAPRTGAQVARAVDGLTRIPLAQAMADAEQFICSCCARPVKRCLADPDWICSTKWKEGTVLQAVRQADRTRPRCLSCGRVLTTAILKRNPLTEVCPSCRRKPITTPTHPE